MAETETLELGPTQGVLHELNREGDTRIIWDRHNTDEVEAAREHFNKLLKRSFTVYRAEGREGTRGEVIREFDPSAERLIAVPRQVGG